MSPSSLPTPETKTTEALEINLEDLPEPKWGPNGKSVYERTYSRTKSDGSKETWGETVLRVVEGNCSFVDEKHIEPNEKAKLFDLIYNFKAIPAGRHLWSTQPTGINATANCFVSVWTEDPADHFCWLFDHLMIGGGVGDNYSAKYRNAMPKVVQSVEIEIKCNSSHPDLEEIGPDHNIDNPAFMYKVEDSREGWVTALRHLFDLAFKDSTVKRVTFDVSDVRPRGARIEGFGGTASGPGPLAELLRAAASTLRGAVGRKLSAIESMDIDHGIACCVVAGNVRRCLPAGTNVHTNQGLIPIEKIEIGQEVKTSTGFEKVTAFFDQGEQKTIKIQTYMGEFECTPNHKMAVMDGVESYTWKEAGDLVPGDSLVFVSSETPGTMVEPPVFTYDKPKMSTTCKDITIPEMNEEFAWFLGQFHGDGYVYCGKEGKPWFNAHVSVACAPDMPETVERITQFFQDMGVDPHLEGPKETDRSTKVRAISKQMAMYFSQFKKAKTEIVIPELIKQSTAEIRAAYLAGLFDSDGAAGNRPILACSSVYPNFLKEVQDLYASLGIATTLKTSRPAEGNWQALYHLSVTGMKFKDKFKNIIEIYADKNTPIKKHSSSKYHYPKQWILDSNYSDKDWSKFWARPEYMSIDGYERMAGDQILVPVEVMEIVEGRLVQTYDIEVENVHEFVAGSGYLVHNSARMSSLNWDDPEILDFISCKSDPSKNWSTNISVAVDEAFFDAINSDDKSSAEYSRAIKIHNAVVAGMVSNGEPGYMNLALANKDKESYTYATNPCGEQFLEPGSACCLAHVNIGAFGKNHYDASEAFRLMSRFALRATNRTFLDEIEKSATEEHRRIGVGFFGLQEYAGLLDVKYSEIPNSYDIRRRMQDFYGIVRKEADKYSNELGWNAPKDVTTIAPTGTIASLAGQTTGCEPIFSPYYERLVRYSSDDPALEDFIAEGLKVEPCVYSDNTSVVYHPTKDILFDKIDESLVEGQSDLTVRQHLEVQASLQSWFADNAISKTCSIPADKTPEEIQEFSDTLLELLPKLKGTTVFPEVSRPQSPFQELTEEQYNAEVAPGSEGEMGYVEQDCGPLGCPIK